MTLGKKILIIAGSLSGVSIALIFAAVLFLQSNSFQERIKQQINQNIPGYLSWEAMSLAVFSGKCHIRGLKLEDEHRTTIAQIPWLLFDLSWKHLIRKEIYLSAVQAEGFNLNLRVTPKDGLNLLSAMVAGDRASDKKKDTPFILPLNIRINKIAFTNGTLDFNMAKQGVESSASGIDLIATDLDLFGQSAHVALKIRKGSLRRENVFVETSSLIAGADISGDKISNIMVQTDLNGSFLDLRGEVDQIFTTPVLDMTLATRLDFEAAKNVYKTTALPSGKALAEFSIKGQLENPEIFLSFSYGPGVFQGLSVQSLGITSMLKDRVLTIQPGKLESGRGNLFFNGKMDLRRAFPEGFLAGRGDPDQILYELMIRQDNMDLSEIPFLEKNFTGRLSTDLVMTGKGVLPGKISAEVIMGLEVKQLGHGTLFPVMDVRADARAGLEGHTAEIFSLDISSGDMNLKGKARFYMPGFDFSAMALSGQLHLDAQNLNRLKSLIPISAEGPVRMDVSLAGTMADPSLGAVVDAKDLVMGKVRIGHINAELGFSQGILTIDRAALLNGKSRLDIHGRVMLFKSGSFKAGLHPDMDLTLEGENLFLEDFLAEAKGRVSISGRVSGNPEQLSANITMNGRQLEIYPQTMAAVSARTTLEDNIIEIDEMTLDLTAKGKIENPRVKGTVFFKHIQMFNRTMDPVELEIELEDHQFSMKGNVQGNMEAAYHLVTREFSASLHMDNFLLDPYFRLMGQPDMTGTITAIIRAEGRSDNISDIRAWADMSSLAVSLKNQPFLEAGPTTAIYREGNLTLPGTRVNFVKGGQFRLKGHGYSDSRLSFEAFGSVPLEIISPFVQGLETAKGDIAITATLGGTVKKPLFHAELTFDDLSWTLGDLDQAFHQISGHIRFTPEKIEILDFSGRLGQGRFDLGGSVGLARGSFKDADLKLNAHQLTLSIPDMMEASLNSRLTFTGTGEKSTLSGEISLLDGIYYKNVDLFPIPRLTGKTREFKRPAKKIKNPFLEHIALNIHVGRQGPLLVDNNMAYLMVSPDLHLGGTAAAPVLTGRATVDSGSINFHKTEFDVQKGVVEFVNPYKIEPVIDIQGETRIRSWTIVLAVSGRLDDLNLQLYSSPSESHADIISLIAFGKTAREMGESRTGGPADPGVLVSGLLAEALGKNLKAATGMDKLEINVDDRAVSGSQSVRVTVGKTLSRQMGVTYDVDTRAGETIQRMTTFYKLLENLLMSGFQDSSGKMGGELKYRLEFR